MIDQSDDRERYEDEVSRAIMLSPRKYKIEKIIKTTTDFYDNKLKDSINSIRETRLIEISKEGRISIKDT